MVRYGSRGGVVGSFGETGEEMRISSDQRGHTHPVVQRYCAF